MRTFYSFPAARRRRLFYTFFLSVFLLTFGIRPLQAQHSMGEAKTTNSLNDNAYCIPEATNANRHINNFSTTGAINNISNLNSGFSTNGYGDFTDMVLSQENTGEVSFEADIVGGTAGFRIWVDWNNDGEFTSDEVVYQSSAYSASHSGSFTIPEDAEPGQTRMRMVSHWLNSSGNISPCETGFTYGEFEDYTIEVIELDDCDGMPVVGTPDETEIEICAGDPFTISVSDASGAANNLFRRWQSSPAGEDDWTDIENSSAANLTLSDGVVEATDFRYVLTCDDEDTAISDIIEVSLKSANECLCVPPAPTYDTLYWIESVTTTNGILDISNPDTGFSSDGYGDYSETHSLLVEPGQDFDFEVKSQNGSSPGLKIWIDWNQNGFFEDGELVFDSSSGETSSLNTYTGTISVPEDAPYGEARMRIRNFKDQEPCNGLSYGETEDYTVEIVELEDCEGPVTAGTIEDDFEVCAAIAFTVSVSDASDPANGLVRQWQSSPAGEDDWTDIENAHSVSLNLTNGITEPTDFRFSVTCDEDESDISDVVTVTLKPANECYCTPGGTNDSYYINDFITTGGIENIENLNSGHSPNGYGDFTETHTVSQIQTQSVEFEADYEGGTFGTKIWVDWNQDGQFSDDEIVYQTSSYSSSASGSFEVPETATPGTTRMRVGISYTPNSGPESPCEVGSREFEDYAFEVIALEDCEGTPTAGTVEDELNVCEGIAFTLISEGSSLPALGLEKIWQSSPAGEDDWTDIEGSDHPEYEVTEGILENTDFRFKVTCTISDETDFSDVIQVSLKPGTECYCIPSGAGDNSDEIRNFTLGTINNDSDASASTNGYTDYTETVAPAELEIGEAYTASLTAGTGSGSHGAAIWIDLNDDGIFAEDEMIAYVSGITANSTVDFPEFIAPDNPGIHRLRVQYTYNQSGENLDPCDIPTTYSETEDYLVDLIELEDCEGTVTAGDLIEEEISVCPGTAFIIGVENASPAANGLERVWQSSPAGEDNWTDIEDANYYSYEMVDGITEETDFRFKISCSNSDETDYSDILQVTFKPVSECYCTPGGTNSSYYINNFSTSGGEENIENLNSGHSPNGYGDFTETHTVSQVRTLPVSFEADYVGGTYGTKIWVDWNQDGQFTDDEIVYQTSSYSSSESGSFTVPESAELGNTRMRIGIAWSPSSGPNSPCESGSREFEDYTFEVLPLEDCEGTPIAGTPDETEIEVCAGNPFTVAVSDATGAANNLNRRWQSSPAGEDDWTDISDSDFSSFTITEGVFEDTDFRYALTCDEEDSAYSDIIQVTLKPGVECYCTPEGSNNNADEIVNFTLANLDNDSSPSEGVNGYSDYTHLGPIQLIPGVDYVASLTSGTGSGSHGAAIWIDYNDDGFFSEDEKVASIPSTITANSTVDFPAFTASAQVGLHRLRVQYAYNKDGDELDPCNITTGFSETEDYMVLIVDVDCFPPTGVEVNYITDVSAEVSWQANDETSWVVTYGETGFDPETEGTEVQVNGTPSINLTDLDEETTYDVYVQTICEDENSVVIGPVTFTTNITPPDNTRMCDAFELTPNTGCVGGPYTNVAAFEELNEPIGSCLNDYRGRNTVWFTFVATDVEAVISTNFNSTDFLTEIVAFEAPADCEDMDTLGAEVGCANASSDGTLLLEGLTPGDTYYVKVGGFNNTEGMFCIEVQMDEAPVCLPPSDVSVEDLTHDSALISWTANGSASQWEVVYGEPGFDPDNAEESLIVDTPEAHLTDLEEDTEYDVYVRSICGQTYMSQWSDAVNFTTEEMSVDNQVFADFTFYPNPVEDLLILKSGTPIESIEIFNLLGQKVFEAKPNATEVQVDAEGLQSGVYLMNIQLNSLQKSFRIIKK